VIAGPALDVESREVPMSDADYASALLRWHSKQRLRFDGAEVRTQVANARRKIRRGWNPKRIPFYRFVLPILTNS
jgi:hypothetical protein